jgi:hypothetical protein
MIGQAIINHTLINLNLPNIFAVCSYHNIGNVNLNGQRLNWSGHGLT